MNKITLSGSQATVEETGIIGFLTGSVVNPFVGQPLTAPQAGIFGGLCFVGGAAAYWAFGAKVQDKLNRSSSDAVSGNGGTGSANNTVYY